MRNVFDGGEAATVTGPDGFAGTQPGRGVLEGAFVLLDALSRFSAGAGLSALAREAGLPKTTTYRLIEQLVELGAVQRHGRRYVVGRLLARLGTAWAPDPTLRQAASQPIRTLAEISGSAVGVWVLHEDRLRTVASTPGATGEAYLPHRGEVPEHTAAGQVLFATRPGAPQDDAVPARERRLRSAAGWHSAVAVDEEGVLPGVSCVATAVRALDGRPVAAVSALTLTKVVPTGLSDLVRRASREITRNMSVR